MKKVLIIAIAAVLSSCSATAPPKENEVKQMVELWYIQESSADGAGRWDVKEINVLSIERDKDNKKIFQTTSLVNGLHHSQAVGRPLTSEPFSDTLRMNLTWNGAKWVTID
jgi:hypothetical protein